MPMNKNRIYWGGLLILGGSLSLLWALGFFDKGFLDVAYTLWPVMLIAFGVTVLFKRMPLLKLAMWVTLVVAFIVLGINRESLTFVKPFDINWFNRLPETIDLTDQVASEFKTEQRSKAVLEIAGSNLDIILSSRDENVSEFVYLDSQFDLKDLSTSNALHFRLAQYSASESADADVAMPSSPETSDFESSSSVGRAELALDVAVPWRLNFEGDFLTGNLDLRELNVESLSIKTAAGDMTVQLGSISALTRIDIDAAAATFSVDVPKSVGVRMLKDGLITSFEYNGPHREDKDYIYSENYDTAAKKIEITFSNAIGEFILHHDTEE